MHCFTDLGVTPCFALFVDMKTLSTDLFVERVENFCFQKTILY